MCLSCCNARVHLHPNSFTVTLRSSIHSDHANVGGDNHVITFARDTCFRLADLTPEGAEERFAKGNFVRNNFYHSWDFFPWTREPPSYSVTVSNWIRTYKRKYCSSRTQKHTQLARSPPDERFIASSKPCSPQSAI